MSNLSDRTITVPSIVNDFTDEELNAEYHAKTEYENAINNYGAIYKIVSFSDCDKKDDLIKFTKTWILRNFYDGVISFTVKAVDLHLLGYNKDKLQVGDRIAVEFMDTYKTPTIKVLTCLSAKYDLLKPENSTFKIGIPDVSTTLKYRNSLSKPSTTPKYDKYGRLIDRTGLEGEIVSLLEDLGLDIEESKM